LAVDFFEKCPRCEDIFFFCLKVSGHSSNDLHPNRPSKKQLSIRKLQKVSICSFFF
jgi:hypothetical protein